jgi:UDP-N-acetyl-D-mannosaminuronate dehydrogenase
VLADNGAPLRDARILLVGVSYKPGVADVRESPALEIIDQLAAHGARVSFTDPYVEMVQTPAAGQLFHVPEPGEQDWELVIVHTIHPIEQHGWLAARQAVLDTTYRLKAHLTQCGVP